MPNKAISYLCLNPMNLTLRIKLHKIDLSEGAIQTGHFNKVAEDDNGNKKRLENDICADSFDCFIGWLL